MRNKGSRKPLGQLLKEMDLVTEGQIQEALSVQKERGGAIGQIMVDLGFVTEEEVLFALGAQAGMEVVNLDEVSVSEDVLKMVDAQKCNVYRICPISFEKGVLTVAMADPMNVNTLEELTFILGMKVQGCVSNEEQVSHAIERYYGTGTGTDQSVDKILEGMNLNESESEDTKESGVMDLTDTAAMASSAPVIKLLNLILLQAIKDKASDVHFEPYDNYFRIRYRVDGFLYEMSPPPPHLAMALVSRVKVMSNLDIAETRLPQDGRIELAIGSAPVDLRVSTLPTIFGESCCMRILDRSVVELSIESIGLNERELDLIKKFVDKPNGIILVTGPTGSGKTTTLYSALSYANKIDIKIITTEDPVEYDIAGLIQCPVNEEVGSGYSALLRAILRQDPDTILVGEIRDQETAGIAIEAALTGHLVLSTLHTNDGPSAVARLMDIGVEHFLISATLEGIIAQRLVRRICKSCKTFYNPSQEEMYSLGLKAADMLGKQFAYGKGCSECNKTGYKGRTGIYEFIVGTENFKQAILDHASTSALYEIAVSEGTLPLQKAGLSCIVKGLSTVEEVGRAVGGGH
ncbi:MAG: ATPase, T2SS/T4P/T4SS family [Planctomycetota bacterium]